MARHAVIDLAQVFDTRPQAGRGRLLTPQTLAELRKQLAAAGIPLRAGVDTDDKLRELAELYEPYVNALAARFLLRVPPWIRPADAKDNWQSTAYDKGSERHFG